MNDQNVDWKQIAMELKQRLIFCLNHGKFGSGMFLDFESGTTQSVKDYLADGLEMVPGVKVNRELMHMTPAQRRKAASKQKGATHDE